MIRSLDCLRNPKNPNYIKDTSTINSSNRTTIIPISTGSGLTNAPTVTYRFSIHNNNSNSDSNSPSSSSNNNSNLSNENSTNQSSTHTNNQSTNSSGEINNQNNQSTINFNSKNTRTQSPAQRRNKSRLNQQNYFNTRAQNITTLYEHQVIGFLDFYSNYRVLQIFFLSFFNSNYAKNISMNLTHPPTVRCISNHGLKKRFKNLTTKFIH